MGIQNDEVEVIKLGDFLESEIYDMEKQTMKIEIQVSEDELNVMIEKFIKENLKLSDNMKLIDKRSYSGVYIFSDEEKQDEKNNRC